MFSRRKFIAKSIKTSVGIAGLALIEPTAKAAPIKKTFGGVIGIVVVGLPLPPYLKTSIAMPGVQVGIMRLAADSCIIYRKLYF